MTLLDLDWRFLLPMPGEGSFRRLLVLGAPAAVVDELRRLELASEITLGSEPGERADAVVCLSPARLDIVDAAAHLAMGGTLYWEAERRAVAPLQASPARLEARLRRLGLTPRGIYWVHPGFTGPRAYFPLEVERSLEWYVKHLSIAPSPSVAAAARFLFRALAWIHPHRFGPLVSRIAAVATSDPDTAAGPAVLAGPELPARLQQKGLRPLLLSHGEHVNRAAMLPFTPTSPEPLAVLKIDRRPDAAARRDEQAALAAIRRCLSPDMRATIPEPLAVVRRGAVTATVESFLPGERLYTRWQRFGYTGSDRIEDLELVTEWLIAFHGQSLVETRRWGTREIDECVESPIRDYEAAFGATPAEAELFDRARAYARNVLELDLPVVWRHGDFLSINILRSNRSIRVVDWEHAEPGLPLDDLLYFARGVAVTPRRRGQARDPREPTVAAFRRLFAQPDGRDSVVGAVRAAVATYMEKLELDERLYPLVLLHGSVRRAVERLERELLTNAGGGPDTPNLYVRCVRVLAERPELLFP